METVAALGATPCSSGIGSSSISSGSRSEPRRGPQRVSCSSNYALVSARCSQASAGSRRNLQAVAELRFGLAALRQRRSLSKVATRSSTQENSEVKVEEETTESKVEEKTQELERQAEESKAAYVEAVDALKEEAVKVQSSAKGSYEESAEKAIEVLRDTTDKLREEAEKARAILTATAIETAELGKSNLNLLAENAPDPIKEIAETAVNAHLKENTKQGARIHDFCLGIPYGAFLVAGGLLWFIITGSTAAIRFGVILGGILLALSVTSLKVWKESKSSIPYIKGQAAIAFIIFVKDARRFLETGAFFPIGVATVVSAAMLGFYIYVYLSGGNPPKKEKVTQPVSAA